MPDRFVNPYTFVPFPEAFAARSAPHGHRGDSRLWSGTIGITITACTPVLVRGTCGADNTTLPHRPGPDGTTQQIIPGSSLHGAVRALHETLTGSCLRVFDQDFSPVYRDVAANTHLLRLAVVQEVDAHGRPTRFQLCHRASNQQQQQRQRIPHRLLRTLGGADLLASGTRLDLEMDNESVVQAREDPAGPWVVFISDSGARSGSYHAAVRELCDDPSPTLGDAAWQDYLAAVEHTDDMRTAGDADPPLVTVHWPPGDGTGRPGPAVGRRYRASRTLLVGQPVWLRLNGSDVVQLQLAHIWRHRGTTARQQGAQAAGDPVPDPARERVPAEALACTEVAQLCPSCRLLGAADTREHEKREEGTERSRPADQQSYRGHVRFSDAVRQGEPTELKVTLPPMGTPHPGAGQFYLEARDVGKAGQPPLREWGSTADDEGGLRRLRGRKFYWHTRGADQGAQHRRGNARLHQREDHPELIAPAVAFPRKAEFTATVTVVDVDLEQLGSLLATLEPSTVLDRKDLVAHLGGGRPLGYGSCTISVDPARTRLWRSAIRYGAGTDGSTVDEIRGAAIAAFHDATPAGVRQTWPALAAALTLNHVSSDQVWYPPGARWADRNGDRGKTFDEGYEFWRQTSGLQQSGRRGLPLCALPSIADDDQSMPIVVEATALPLDEKKR